MNTRNMAYVIHADGERTQFLHGDRWYTYFISGWRPHGDWDYPSDLTSCLWFVPGTMESEL